MLKELNKVKNNLVNILDELTDSDTNIEVIESRDVYNYSVALKNVVDVINRTAKDLAKWAKESEDEID